MAVGAGGPPYHRGVVAPETEPAPSARRRAVPGILLYGLTGGGLIAVLKLAGAPFLVVESAVELYSGLIAAGGARQAGRAGPPHGGAVRGALEQLELTLLKPLPVGLVLTAASAVVLRKH